MKRIENWIFYIFLFAIPISLRHIFDYESFGFIEWKAIYIYATDVIFLVLLLFWLASRPKIKISIPDWFLLLFLAAGALSILNSFSKELSIFQLIKLLQGVILYFYVKDYALNRFSMEHSFVALVLGGLFQGLIAISQFTTQGSLGLKYLGESILAPAMNGIAAFYADGVKVIRAYGTTPHSNILAAYLFVALGAFYSIGIYQKRRWWWHIFHAVILWAFLLTFSRVIIALWAITFAIRTFLIRFSNIFRSEFWDNPEMGKRGLKIFLTTLIVCTLFIGTYWPYIVDRLTVSRNDEAVKMRILYNEQSFETDQKLLGVGIGNFVPWLMSKELQIEKNLYQPVHNIYLLVYAEIGIIGLILFLGFLISSIYLFYIHTHFKKLYFFSFALIISVILLTGLFDHFLWTTQSGRLTLWLVLGLLAGAREDAKYIANY